MHTIRREILNEEVIAGSRWPSATPSTSPSSSSAASRPSCWTRSCSTSTWPGWAPRSTPRARPALPLPRPADAVRPLLPARQRQPHRAAASVLDARRHGPGAGRDRPRGARHRVLRDHVGLLLHVLHAHAVQRRHPAPQLSSCFLTTVATTWTRSSRRSRTTRCCRSTPAASATTGPTSARSAPISRAPTARARASCRS